MGAVLKLQGRPLPDSQKVGEAGALKDIYDAGLGSAHPGFSRVFATVVPTRHKLLAQVLGISGSLGTLQLQELGESLKSLIGLTSSPEAPKADPGRDSAAKSLADSSHSAEN